MDPTTAARAPLAVESPRIRVQRFGAPFDAAKLLARLLASAAVTVGAISLALLDGGPFTGAVAIFGFFFIVVAALASVPLGAALVWTWLFALFARGRKGGLYVGRSLCVERARSLDTFAPADVVSVSTDATAGPGGVVIRMESGDVIRAELADLTRTLAITDAVADGSARGPWLSPLYAPAPAREWLRGTAVGLTVLAALVLSGLSVHGEAIGALCGCAGLLVWLTVLRPGPERRRLAIGTDGVDLRGEAERRFIAFNTVERVEPTPYGGDLMLADGERVALAVVPSALLGRDHASSAALALALSRRTALLERLQAGLAATEALAGEERLACQGLRVSAWREAVRGLVNESAPGYRVALLPTEQAARIVERGRAAPEARIGAALALAGQADEPLKQRLRIAIDDCADEATQAAIAQALEDRLDPWTLARVQRAGERR